MRRKLAQPINPKDAADLPDLTEQQKCFLDGLLSGKRLAEAYRAAYDCSHMQQNSIWVDASRLRSNPKIVLWLAAARKAGLGHAVVTLEGHVSELERLREIALETGNVGAAVQAEHFRGKASGQYKETTELIISDPNETLKQIAQVSPELAARIAREQGIEWESETAH
jgi:hypothetical protein